MYRIGSLIVLCIVIISTLTGCYDAKELNDLYYVSFIGIDKGISDKWRITYVIPMVHEESDNQGQSSGGLTFSSIVIDAPSFSAAIELATTNVPKMLNFMHTQFIVFSEEVAEGGLVGEYIAPLMRSREVRLSTHMIVAKGSAEEFVKSFESFTGVDISRITTNLMQQSAETGYSESLSLYDFYDCMKSTYHQPILISGAVNKGDNFIEEGKKWGKAFTISGDYYAGDMPRKQGNEIDLLGLVIFDGDRMVGKLTGYETRLLAIGKGTFKKGYFTIQDPKKPDLVIPMDTRLKRKPKLDIHFEGMQPIIHLKVELEGNILAIQSGINYEDPKMQPILEKSLEQFINTGLDRTIKKTQELNCDVFKFGQTAVRHFGTIQEWEKHEWNKHYKEAKITTEVKFTIRRTGTKIYNSPIIFSGE
jgi:spore germination protein KC